MITYQWTSAILAIVIAGSIIWLVRHNRLQAGKAVFWVLLAVAIAFGGIAPGVVDSVAVHLGVHYPPVLAMLIGLGIVLIKLLRVDIERSEESRQLRVLAQKLAILEASLDTEDREKSLDRGSDQSSSNST